MSPAERISRNLKFLRGWSGFTQEQMAEVIGMTLKFYQAIETGRKPQLKVETLERLGRPFGIEPWLLLAPEAHLKRTRLKQPKPLRDAPRGPRSS